MDALPPRLQVLYPFTPRRHSTAEGALSYVDEGSGPPVVMLHGNPTWSFLYRDLILALRRDCRCLAVDHLGCGLSDKPARAGYTLAGHIGRTADWIRALELGGFHLVVHDWGGAIGFGVAAALAAEVRSITILNTAAFPFPSIPARIAACRIPLLGTLMVRGANAFVRAAGTMTTAQPLSEAAREGYAFPYNSWADRVAIDAFVTDIPMRRRHRSWGVLKAIGDGLPQWRGKPVQVLWGMRDWCFHAGILEEWRRILPDATVRCFAEAGHYVLDDAGAEAREAVAAFVLAAQAMRP